MKSVDAKSHNVSNYIFFMNKSLRLYIGEDISHTCKDTYHNVSRLLDHPLNSYPKGM